MKKYEFDYLDARLDEMESAIAAICISLGGNFQALNHLHDLPTTLMMSTSNLRRVMLLNYLQGKSLVGGGVFDIENIAGTRNKLKEYLPRSVIRDGSVHCDVTMEGLNTVPGCTSVVVAGKVVTTLTLPTGRLHITTATNHHMYTSDVELDGGEMVTVHGEVTFTDDELLGCVGVIYNHLGLELPQAIPFSALADELAESKLAEFCHVNLSTLYDTIATLDLRPNTVGGLEMLAKISHINGVILKYHLDGNIFRYNIGTGDIGISRSGWCESVGWDKLTLSDQKYARKALLDFATLLWSHLNRHKESA